jgi:hypothetical protein
MRDWIKENWDTWLELAVFVVQEHHVLCISAIGGSSFIASFVQICNGDIKSAKLKALHKNMRGGGLFSSEMRAAKFVKGNIIRNPVDFWHGKDFTVAFGVVGGQLKFGLSVKSPCDEYCAEIGEALAFHRMHNNRLPELINGEPVNI